MRRKYIQYLFIYIATLALTACSGDRQKVEKPANVHTFTINNAANGEYVEFPGKVVAAQEVNLGFKVSGTLSAIHVKEGASFRKGQLIAEIDPADYQIQFNAVEAEYRKVKAEAERIIALYKDSVATADAYDKARYGLQQITAKYENAKNQLEYTRLYAPFDGKMQKHLFDAATVVSAGMPVVSIISAGIPEIEISIPAATYMSIDDVVSYTASFDFASQSNTPLSLISVSPKANANQLYTVRFAIPAGLKPMPSPGMNTTVSLAYKSIDSRINIPSSAIFNSDEQTCVWIIRSDSTVVARNVTVEALHTNGSATVSSGLNAGDIIVTAGVRKLIKGQKVSPIPAPTKTNIGGLL